MNNCLFCQLINRDIPAQIVFEDKEIFVFKDIKPRAEIHFLIIPKRHIPSMLELTDHDQALMGKIMIVANQLAQEHGLLNGYKTQINTGINGGQEVAHLHLHLFGNR